MTATYISFRGQQPMHETKRPHAIEIYVCMNIDCRNRGAEAVLRQLKEKAQASSGVQIVMKPYLCFSACNIGPNLVIPEKRCWFSGVSVNDIDAVIAYLNGGTDLPRLKGKNDPELEEMIFAIIDAGLNVE
jgi:NADH:ubiquinone oxidoreductase subunit E